MGTEHSFAGEGSGHSANLPPLCRQVS